MTSAARRASPASSFEQQPREPVRSASGVCDSARCTPTTSCPASTARAAATAESTPPDIAASTLMRGPLRPCRGVLAHGRTCARTPGGVRSLDAPENDRSSGLPRRAAPARRPRRSRPSPARRRRRSWCGRGRTAATPARWPRPPPSRAVRGWAARRLRCRPSRWSTRCRCASSSMSSESPSQPGKLRWALPGRREGPPSMTSVPWSPFSVASGTLARTLPTRSSRSPAISSARRGASRTASSTAVARPTTPGVSSVPDRTSRSCPPPCSSGVSATSRPSSSAPAPMGPPSLCPVSVSASTPDAAKSTGRIPTACTASVCSGTPCSCATAASSRTGLTVPTSLLAHITDTSATEPGSSASAARRTSGRTRPTRSTGSRSTRAPSCSASHRAASSTAWCSIAETSTRRRRSSAARRAQ